MKTILIDKPPFRVSVRIEVFDGGPPVENVEVRASKEMEQKLFLVSLKAMETAVANTNLELT